MNQENKPETVEQYVNKVATFLEICIYTPMEAFEHGVNAGIDWQSDLLQYMTNERDELQKQVVTLEYEINASQHSYTEQKWVSVEDRLPENRHWVLVMSSSELFLANYKHGLFYNGLEVLYKPTHWMPLPSPPNSKTLTPPTYTQEQMIAFGEEIKGLKSQLNNQEKHKQSIKQYWLSCSENKKKWEDAIKEYFDSEYTESIQSFDDFKEQFDLD